MLTYLILMMENSEMNNHKFRVYRGDKMVYGPPMVVDHESGELMSVLPGPLMQWTGLVDREFKAIYDGDIVKNHSKYLNDDKYYGVSEVIYRAPSFVLARGLQSIWYPTDIADSLEVIGNIFDNPELLK